MPPALPARALPRAGPPAIGLMMMAIMRAGCRGFHRGAERGRRRQRSTAGVSNERSYSHRSDTEPESDQPGLEAFTSILK